MSGIHFASHKGHAARFGTGVSLHGHTLHSRETLDFVHRSTCDTPWLSGFIRKQQAKYRALNGADFDLKRAWWTPPLSARQAWELEKGQIENLGLRPYVSLSDHDTIDGCLQLRLFADLRDEPISVEWTVPFRQTFFHVGAHNVPFDLSAEISQSMAELTARPDEARIARLLEWLGEAPDSLVILNHPLWDESHIGTEAHNECATAFLETFGAFIHALELNGLRPWQENRKVIQLAGHHGLPVISGGDRHGKEPNACINLTNAATFGEFADEIRRDHQSEILFLPQYREPLKMRVLESITDVLVDDPHHAMGWVSWSDRVFCQTEDGGVRSVRELLGEDVSGVVSTLISLMSFVKNRSLRSALRLALADSTDLAITGLPGFD
ncbi:MAG TPA: hypothetical protein VNH18_30455 [Bryobacteraceae bacterium]|nr:hypothetical protein [Bryobacteraceae bacterium]